MAKKSDARWEVNPFGEVRNARGRPVKRKGFPTYTAKQRKRMRKIERGWKKYRDTGDRTILIEMGIFPKPDA